MNKSQYLTVKRALNRRGRLRPLVVLDHENYKDYDRLPHIADFGDGLVIVDQGHEDLSLRDVPIEALSFYMPTDIGLIDESDSSSATAT